MLDFTGVNMENPRLNVAREGDSNDAGATPAIANFNGVRLTLVLVGESLKSYDEFECT